MRTIELFCGIGMSALGIERAGADLVGAVDIDKRFVKAFNGQTVLPDVAQIGDIAEYTPPEKIDLLSGGPVCKAFSPGATLFGTAGKDDSRNTFPLFFETLKKCDPLPSYVLIENTSGLRRFKGYVNELRGQLRYLNYTVDLREVDCFDYGVPQTRKRLVFTAWQHGATPWRITKPDIRTGPKTVGDCFGSTNEELLRNLSPGCLAYLTRDPIHLKKHKPLTLDRRASTVVGNYKRGVPYGVVEKGGRYYRCMPRLAARLQGLPDSYDLSSLSVTAALEGIGNGFPTPVVEHLVGSLT